MTVPSRALVLTGWFEHEAGNHGNALDLYEEALRMAATGLDRFTLGQIAEHFALLLATLGRFEDAARIEGYYEANRSRPEPEIYASHYERHRVLYREALGDRTEVLKAEGAAMTPEQMCDFGLRVIAEAEESIGHSQSQTPNISRVNPLLMLLSLRERWHRCPQR